MPIDQSVRGSYSSPYSASSARSARASKNEWAIATRVQGDKDIVIVPGARAKPLDPSLLQGAGVVPIGAKVGIDATIPEHIPKEHYERITYAYAETAKVDDYVKGKTDKAGRVVVEPDLSVKGFPAIQVIGDLAAAQSHAPGQPPRPVPGGSR